MASETKEHQSLNHLQKSIRLEREMQQAAKIRLSHITNNITRRLSMVGKNSKLASCYHKLVNFAKNAKAKQEKTKKTLSNLLKSLSNSNVKKRLENSLNTLRKFNNEQKHLSNRKRNLLTRIFSNLAKSCKSKENQSLKTLKKFNQNMREKLRNLIRRLLANNKNTMRNSLKKLVDFSTKTSAKTKQKSKILQAWKNKLLNKTKKEMINALNKLREMAKNSRRIESEKSIIQNQNLNKKRGILQNLAKKTNFALRFVLNKLRENAKSVADEQRRKKYLTSIEQQKSNNAKVRIFRRLSGLAEVNKQNTLQKLRSFVTITKAKRQKMDDAIKKMMRKIKTANKNDSSRVLEKLRKHAKQSRMASEEIMRKKRNAISRLIKNLSQKQTKAIESLKQNNARKKKIAKLVIQKLLSSSQFSKRNALNKLRQLNSLTSTRITRRIKAGQTLAHKLAQKEIHQYLAKLIMNYLSCLLKDSKRRRTLDRMKILAKVKKYSAYAKLISSTKLVALTKKLHSMVIVELLKKSTMAHQTNTLNKLREFVRIRIQRRGEALKTVRRSVLKDTAHFLRKLRMNHFLHDRNKKSQSLLGMSYVVKKNHRLLKKLVFDRWACKSLVLKLKNLQSRLEGWQAKRKGFGMEAFKRNWALSKYKNLIAWVHKVTPAVDRMVSKRPQDALKHIIDLLKNTNAWYRKTINIWVFLSKINVQNSFWRMRYGKNMKQNTFSPETSLKFKKVIFILQKQIQKNLNLGFWKIHAESAASNSRQTLHQSMMLPQGFSLGQSQTMQIPRTLTRVKRPNEF